MATADPDFLQGLYVCALRPLPKGETCKWVRAVREHYPYMLSVSCPPPKTIPQPFGVFAMVLNKYPSESLTEGEKEALSVFIDSEYARVLAHKEALKLKCLGEQPPAYPPVEPPVDPGDEPEPGEEPEPDKKYEVTKDTGTLIIVGALAAVAVLMLSK